MKHFRVFWGKVREGHKRGKKLGFPTANMRIHNHIPEGIYVSQTIMNKKIYPSVTFIGSAKTYGEKDYKAETFILNFHQNIYGKWITIQLFKKIRENKKFNSENELLEQMKKDIREAEDYFIKAIS